MVLEPVFEGGEHAADVPLGNQPFFPTSQPALEQRMAAFGKAHDGEFLPMLRLDPFQHFDGQSRWVDPVVEAVEPEPGAALGGEVVAPVVIFRRSRAHLFQRPFDRHQRGVGAQLVGQFAEVDLLAERCRAAGQGNREGAIGL